MTDAMCDNIPTVITREIMGKIPTLKILPQNFIKLCYDRDVTVIKLDRQHRYSNKKYRYVL